MKKTQLVFSSSKDFYLKFFEFFYLSQYFTLTIVLLSMLKENKIKDTKICLSNLIS